MSLILVAWLGAVTSVCGWALLAGPPAARPPAEGSLRLVIVRPCAGPEPELQRCLASWPVLREGHLAGAIFAVGEVDDPALPAAETAAARLRTRGVDARVVVTSAEGPNHKASQLAVAVDGAGEVDVIVVADSDVDLEGLDLGALVDPIAADARVAACWAPPVELGVARTWGDRASQALLGASLHAFPVLARLDRRGMVGKLVALRRSSLAAVGGFASLTGVLGEDMELARRFARRGEEVAVAPIVAPSLASGRDLRGALSRYTRWISVIRRQRPALLASYPLLFAATPLMVPLALAAGAPWIAGAAVALRFSVARLAQSACGRRRSLAGTLLEAVLADALLLAAFAHALASPRVVWRGARLRVLAGGRLTG